MTFRASYSPHVDRIGKLPASMTTDFGPPIQSGKVFVAERAGEIVASIVLWPHGDSLEISPLAVRPSLQRQGLGRLLPRFAERCAIARMHETQPLHECQARRACNLLHQARLRCGRSSK